MDAALKEQIVVTPGLVEYAGKSARLTDAMTKVMRLLVKN